MFTSSAGYWKRITSAYVSSGGVWKKITSAYVSSGGVWKKYFSFGGATISIESPVTMTPAPGSNLTYPENLTGRNYHWTNATSLTYVFQKSSDNSNWSNINSPTTIANPVAGSSNTVQRAAATADFSSYYGSYFRFQVTAVNGTSTKISTSPSTNIWYPVPYIASGTFSGTFYVGQTVTFTAGTWDSGILSSYTYIRTSDASYIAGQGTGNSFSWTIPAAMAGKYYYADVTGYGQFGATSGGGASSPTITTAPVPTAAQGTFGGGTVRGEMITYTPGATTNASSVTSYLIRADAYNTQLASATGTSSVLYFTTASDVGYQLYGYTAATGYGTTVYSQARFSSYITGPVVAAPTAATGSWSGTAAVGSSITYTRGASTNATSTVIYWYRSDGALFVNAGTASAYAYTVTSNDVGYYFYAYSVATNSGGSATSSNSYTGTVTAPVVLAVPGPLTSLTGSNNLSPIGGTFNWGAPSSGGAVSAYYWAVTKGGVAHSAGYTTNTYVEIREVGSFQAKVNAYNGTGDGPVRTSSSVSFT